MGSHQCDEGRIRLFLFGVIHLLYSQPKLVARLSHQHRVAGEPRQERPFAVMSVKSDLIGEAESGNI
jgi:hypothetical protein